MNQAYTSTASDLLQHLATSLPVTRCPSIRRSWKDRNKRGNNGDGPATRSDSVRGISWHFATKFDSSADLGGRGDW
jgi:hypothetical protein